MDLTLTSLTGLQSLDVACKHYLMLTVGCRYTIQAIPFTNTQRLNHCLALNVSKCCVSSMVIPSSKDANTSVESANALSIIWTCWLLLGLILTVNGRGAKVISWSLKRVRVHGQ